MSSEKILQKISEKDLKENLTPEQYDEYLENEKVEKLAKAKPYIKQDFLVACFIYVASSMVVLSHCYLEDKFTQG